MTTIGPKDQNELDRIYKEFTTSNKGIFAENGIYVIKDKQIEVPGKIIKSWKSTIDNIGERIDTDTVSARKIIPYLKNYYKRQGQVPSQASAKEKEELEVAYYSYLRQLISINPSERTWWFKQMGILEPQKLLAWFGDRVLKAKHHEPFAAPIKAVQLQSAPKVNDAAQRPSTTSKKPINANTLLSAAPEDLREISHLRVVQNQLKSTTKEKRSEHIDKEQLSIKIEEANVEITLSASDQQILETKYKEFKARDKALFIENGGYTLKDKHFEVPGKVFKSWKSKKKTAGERIDVDTLSSEKIVPWLRNYAKHNGKVVGGQIKESERADLELAFYCYLKDALKEGLLKSYCFKDTMKLIDWFGANVLGKRERAQTKPHHRPTPSVSISTSATSRGSSLSIDSPTPTPSPILKPTHLSIDPQLIDPQEAFSLSSSRSRSSSSSSRLAVPESQKHRKAASFDAILEELPAVSKEKAKPKIEIDPKAMEKLGQKTVEVIAAVEKEAKRIIGVTEEGVFDSAKKVNELSDQASEGAIDALHDVGAGVSEIGSKPATLVSDLKMAVNDASNQAKEGVTAVGEGAKAVFTSIAESLSSFGQKAAAIATQAAKDAAVKIAEKKAHKAKEADTKESAALTPAQKALANFDVKLKVFLAKGVPAEIDPIANELEDIVSAYETVAEHDHDPEIEALIEQLGSEKRKVVSLKNADAEEITERFNALKDLYDERSASSSKKSEESEESNSVEADVKEADADVKEAAATVATAQPAPVTARVNLSIEEYNKQLFKDLEANGIAPKRYKTDKEIQAELLKSLEELRDTSKPQPRKSVTIEAAKETAKLQQLDPKDYKDLNEYERKLYKFLVGEDPLEHALSEADQKLTHFEKMMKKALEKSDSTAKGEVKLSSEFEKEVVAKLETVIDGFREKNEINEELNKASKEYFRAKKELAALKEKGLSTTAVESKISALEKQIAALREHEDSSKIEQQIAMKYAEQSKEMFNRDQTRFNALVGEIAELEKKKVVKQESTQKTQKAAQLVEMLSFELECLKSRRLEDLLLAYKKRRQLGLSTLSADYTDQE